MASVIKNFIVTFCVSLLIFGLLAYAIVSNLQAVFNPALSGNPSDVTTGSLDSSDVTADPASSESASNEDTSPPVTDENGNIISEPEKQSQTLTLLLVGTDFQPSVLQDYDVTELNKNIKGFPIKPRTVSADSILLVHIDGDKKQIIFSSLPSNMRVLTDGNYVPLGSLYASKGITFLCDTVKATTGVTVDYYAVASIEDFAGIIDAVGGITYMVPANMEYVDESQGLVISLKRGSQPLDGKSAANMLRFNLYTNGNESRMALSIDFAKAMLKKLTAGSYLTQVSTLYEQCSKYVETNFSLDALMQYLELIFAYNELDAASVSYPGSPATYDGVLCFDPDIPAAINIFRPYR